MPSMIANSALLFEEWTVSLGLWVLYTYALFSVSVSMQLLHVHLSTCLPLIYFAATWESWSGGLSSSATINATWSSCSGKCYIYLVMSDKSFELASSYCFCCELVILVVDVLFYRWGRNWWLKTDKGIKKSRRSVLECIDLYCDSCESICGFCTSLLSFFKYGLVLYLLSSWCFNL